MTTPRLGVYPSGDLICGVCNHLAIPVEGRDAKGRMKELVTFRHGVPLTIICVFCLKPWEQCDCP